MKTSEVTLAELQGACNRAGAALEYRTVVGGVPEARIICTDGWMAAKLLAEMAADDVGRPNLVESAQAIRTAFLTQGTGARILTPENYAKAVQEVVKKTIRFAYEEGEIFQSTAYTAQTGVGDCDDHARLVVGLFRAGGLKARLAFLAPPGEGPAHVCAQVFVSNAWAWAETTCDAFFGEHPFAAARRLGIIRADITQNAETRTMGDMAIVESVNRMGGSAVGASPVSDAFLIAGAAMSKRLNISWPDLLKTMNFESGLNPNAGTNAKGLIQWDPPPAGLPTTAEGQLPYVESFLQGPAKAGLHSVARLHQAIFLPATVFTIKSGVLLRKGGTGFHGQEAEFYNDNKNGFDPEGKGYITVADMARTTEIAAAKPNSPYLRALARLRVVAPESIPMSGAGAAVVLALFSVGVVGIVEHFNPGAVKRPFLRYVYSARNLLS